MNVVSDTGPLIVLAKIDRLGLLRTLFKRVHIPSSVYHELLAKPGPESVRLEKALQDFLQSTPSPVPASAVVIATMRLHPGEREAIALAYELDALLLIDDHLGRDAARRLGLAVTGAVGVLVHAKQKGHLDLVGPLLIEMRQRGYWLSDELMNVALGLAGERECL